MKKLIMACAAPLALTATPVLAQEDDKAAEEAAVMAQLTEMFASEPLTAEQEARLPLAQDLISMILPDGAMAEIMNSMFDGILDPFMTMAADAGPDLAGHIGSQADALEIGEDEAAEIVALIDPNWRERQQREMMLMPQYMGEIMNAIEPAMRKGMSEAYAVHFTRDELEDIATFFATESGSTYARKSFALSSDPRIMGAMMEQLPTMMEQFAAMGERMKSEMADLGEPHSFDTLTPVQRARIMELTGLSEEKLRNGMEAAANVGAENAPFG